MGAGNYGDGVSCDGTGEAHFTCNACFVELVKSSLSDEPAKQDLRGGRCACPFRTFPPTEGCCDAPCYDDKVIAQKVDAETFVQYQRVRERLIEMKLAREADVEMEKKIAVALREMEAQGVKVFKAQKFIVDEVLTMHCPRCKMAFVDWDGCNALYCTYAGCGCNFCAFCLKDCGGGVVNGQKQIERRGDDLVHKHVAECKYAKGIGHRNDNTVQKEVWNQVRAERIADCLLEMCDTLEQRQKVVDNLKSQFDGLGLKVTVPKGARLETSPALDPPSPPVHQPWALILLWQEGRARAAAALPAAAARARPRLP